MAVAIRVNAEQLPLEYERLVQLADRHARPADAF
jgi:hypothetical protein